MCVQCKTPDDGQRNCPKHAASFQNKFEKLAHLFGFIIGICHDAWSHERKKKK
jgi:peroxiredoxin